MKSYAKHNPIDEGLILYTIWKAVNFHDNSGFRILELAINKELLSKYSKLFPITRICRKCGSYEYVYSKVKAQQILSDNEYLNHKDFSSVLFYSNFHFLENLLKNGIQSAQAKIEKYRKLCLKKYKGLIPKYTLCQLNKNQECNCKKVKIKRPYLSRRQPIGLGVDSKIKFPKVYSSEVIKDEITTIKKKADKHILYAQGWKLDDDD